MSCIDRCGGLQCFSRRASFRGGVVFALAAGFAFGVFLAVACTGFAGVLGGFWFGWHDENVVVPWLLLL